MCVLEPYRVQNPSTIAISDFINYLLDAQIAPVLIWVEI
jgi:hypothetical protein